MSRWIRHRGIACVLLFLLLNLATGCVKLKQAVTVMPDGSGKIDLRFGVSQKLVELAEQNEEDPFKEVLPYVMREKTQGIAAFTVPQRSVEGDFTFLSYSMYFRDINNVQVLGLGEEQATLFRYTREGEGAELTVTRGPALGKMTDYEPTPENEREQVREAMAGLVFHERYVLPGKVEPVDGLATQGNTADLVLTLEHLLEGTGPVPKLKGKKSFTLTMPAVNSDAKAQEAFDKELEEAVAAEAARKKKAQLDL